MTKILPIIVTNQQNNPIFVHMSVAVGIDVGFDSHIVARMTVPSEPTAEPVMEIQKNESKETEFKFIISYMYYIIDVKSSIQMRYYKFVIAFLLSYNHCFIVI